MAPNSAIIFIGVLATTDLTISVFSILLLQQLRMNNQLRKQLGQGGELADKKEVQKTRIILSLCVLIVFQMLSVSAAILFGQVCPPVVLLLSSDVHQA